MRGIGTGTVCNQLSLTERRRIEHSFGSQAHDDLAAYTIAAKAMLDAGSWLLLAPP